MEAKPTGGSVVPFARRWHVIHEIDLVRLIAGHRLRNGLCDRLERVADDLPARPPAEMVAALCGMLAEVLARDGNDALVRLEALLPSGGDGLAQGLIERIRARHAADAATADELVAALLPADQPDVLVPEALGYAIRCFVTGCRATIEFELLAIVALARHRLTPQARALLTECLLPTAPEDLH
ncbi:hypothetical protein FHS96_004745 [Sphingomonas zeicaulis]|uniref:hypothetical protein n=1 Tax=Sphingomonas zeicaulis TaxID=1632740 RepID=UPI003D258CE2